MHFFIEKMNAKVSPRVSQESPKIAPKGFQKESKKNIKKSKKVAGKNQNRGWRNISKYLGGGGGLVPCQLTPPHPPHTHKY